MEDIGVDTGMVATGLAIITIADPIIDTTGDITDGKDDRIARHA